MDEITRKVAIMTVMGGVFLWTFIAGLAGVGVGYLIATIKLNSKEEKVTFGSGRAVELKVKKTYIMWVIAFLIALLFTTVTFWRLYAIVKGVGYL